MVEPYLQDILQVAVAPVSWLLCQGYALISVTNIYECSNLVSLTLCEPSQVLKKKNAKYGVAGVCNGGGGASALVLELV